MLCNIIVLLAYQAMDFCIASITQHSVLYYYADEKRTWHDAYEVCETRSRTMLKVESKDVLTLMQDLNPPSLANATFWIGLHDTDERTKEENYKWSDCTTLGSYQPWRNASNMAKRRCVQASSGHGLDANWVTEDCSKANAYTICQKTKGDCQLGVRTDTRVSSSTQKIHIDVDNSTDCGAKFLEQTIPESWGSEYSRKDGCVIYLTESYTEFISKLHRAEGFSIFVKNCFQAVVYDATNIEELYRLHTKDGKPPDPGCVSDVVPKTTALTKTTVTATSEITQSTVPAETSPVEGTTMTIETVTTPRAEPSAGIPTTTSAVTALSTTILRLTTSSRSAINALSTTTLTASSTKMATTPSSGLLPVNSPTRMAPVTKPRPVNQATLRVYHNVWSLGGVRHPKLNAVPDSTFQVDGVYQCVRSCNISCEAVNYGSWERVCLIYLNFEAAKKQGAMSQNGWFLWVFE